MVRRVCSLSMLVGLCLAFSPGSAVAGTPQILTLKDRSVIRAEILEMKDGVYRVKSPTLGEMKIPADSILSIANENVTLQSGDGSDAAHSAPQSAPAHDLAIPSIREGDGKSTVNPKNSGETKQAATQGQEQGQTAGRMRFQGTSGGQKQEKRGGQSVRSRTGSSQFQTMESGNTGGLMDQTKGLVQSMLMNGSYSEKIMNLGDNEALQGVMSDPEIMKAIQDNDFNYLMNNEKMKQLMESGDVKDILGGAKGEE
ncbi:MAG: hypothetical protein WA705_12185 [Candidatus Ozemobacteraceae bacterium]